MKTATAGLIIAIYAAFAKLKHMINGAAKGYTEMKTLLLSWYGEDLYEEDAPREKLIEILKFQSRQLEAKSASEEMIEQFGFPTTLK